ncbi:MAG: hypothetical protein KG029_03500, partial [Bacteroidetes bacterium]|nr:hypothetical protein [Bacteroidota bacterium]
MNLDQYIGNINQKFKAGNATEHTFRGILEQLIESIVPTIRATNEPKRQSCGAPDYILCIFRIILTPPFRIILTPHSG